MKNVKTMGLLFIIFTLLQQAICARDYHNFDFRTYSTDDFIYTRTSEFEPIHYAAWQATPNYDEIYHSSYHSGITRVRVITELENGRLVTSTERWITKNPSYMTRTNFSRACGGVLLIGSLAYISLDPFASRMLFNSYIISSLLNRW